MMKKLFFLIIILGLTFCVAAQESRPKLKLGVFGGFATYSFEKLEDMNDEVMNQLPFDVALIDNFPSRFYFGGNVLIRVASWYSVGPAYEFHSTGSRVGAKDYSGSYHFDQILSTHQLGIENEIRISGETKTAVFLNLSGGVNFSTWKMEEILTVGEEKQEDKYEYDAIKPFVYPEVKISYPVYKDFSAFAKAGYLFDLGGKYHLSGNKDFQSTVKIPWSGFRVSLGLEFEIK